MGHCGSCWDPEIGEKTLELEKKLERMDDEDDEDFIESIEHSMGIVKNQLHFVKELYDMDLYTTSVPGDGDCLLWSWLSLEGGPVAACQMNSRQHVQDLRNDFWFVESLLLLKK